MNFNIKTIGKYFLLSAIVSVVIGVLILILGLTLEKLWILWFFVFFFLAVPLALIGKGFLFLSKN
jgi:hypothetical protein